MGADLPETLATGEAGTVYLCHPFLVHAAQQHRGSTPRFQWRPPFAEPSVGDRLSITTNGKGAQPSGCALVSSEYRLFNFTSPGTVGKRGADRIETSSRSDGGGSGRCKAMEADHAFRELWQNCCEFSAIVGIQPTTAAGWRRREIGKSEIPE